MQLIDAVITAGGIPQPDEPLYPLTQGKNKALLPIGGRPMVQWIVDALNGAQEIRSLVVVGLSPEDAALTSAKPISYVTNHGSMIGNAAAGVHKVLEQDPQAVHALMVSSDIPTITPAMVTWAIETGLQGEQDVCYSLVPAEAMERRFPGSRRTFFRLKEGRFTGSDMNLFRTSMVHNVHPGWRGIVEARKNVLKQASLIGFDTLLLFALGQLSMAGAVKAAKRGLGVVGRAVICPHAEMGMDVDKPHQYEIVKHDLEARATVGTAA
jgi:CTP:molybdopterin cytidylyltransferase MocA